MIIMLAAARVAVSAISIEAYRASLPYNEEAFNDSSWRHRHRAAIPLHTYYRAY